MKRLLILLFGFTLALIAIPAYAQSSTPTANPGETGEVTGVIVNQSSNGTIPKSATVMLHVLDENYSQLGMLHAESQPDGTFRFEDVPLSAGMYYVGFVTYQGASYTSQPISYDGKVAPNVEVPIYDITNELTDVSVDEMHVLFNFADDGLEVNEIYLISNMGDRTVTGTLTLTDGVPATLQFPLPEKADYVFFKPDDSERFVKLEHGFADKSPLVPGESSSQMMVSYLLPYANQMTYSYTAPLTVRNIDFLLPAEQGVLLQGENLLGPETTSLQDGSIYQVYTSQGLSQGQTLKFDFLGKPTIQSTNSAEDNITGQSKLPVNWVLGIAGGFFGVLMIAFGVWQWRKSREDSEDEEGIEDESYDGEFSQVVADIARLDQAHERGELDEAEYALQRAGLRKQAKTLLEQMDEQ